ncbi:MAG: four helix bundle protein [Clostridia bacterium]|nr:four helix bundle protein [Clostridia bacterium]
MPDGKTLDEAKTLAVSIIEISRLIKERKKEAVLANQLIRSGTSIGANLYEAKYAQSTPDFISKLQIALKECYETEYWLDLLQRTDCITEEEYKPLMNKCGSIRRMLIASINTAKSNFN